MAGFSQDSLFELGEVFCLPFSAILFLLECSPKGRREARVVVFGDLADSFVFEELLGCIGIVGRCQIRPEVVPMIAVLFSDEWNYSHAENCTVDLLVHGVTSRDSMKFAVGSS